MKNCYHFHLCPEKQLLSVSALVIVALHISISQTQSSFIFTSKPLYWLKVVNGNVSQAGWHMMYAFMSNWTIDLRDCAVADFDILFGISAGRCSSFRHLTYITLNMAAHQHTWMRAHITVHTNAHSRTVPCPVCVCMSSVVIAPDISRIEFGVNVDVLYKPIIQSALSWLLGSKGRVMSYFLTTWQKA